MAVSLHERLGVLAERDFRLLFTATTITTVGDRLASIALAFAVLEFGSATDLGIVLGVRQGVEAVVLLAGGVLSDRLPRQLVLTGASLVQGTAQAATAAVILAGTDSLSAVVAFQALYGVGGGLVVPAEVGLVPQTVSSARLQQANALQGLSRNVVGVLGPAVGGAIVVASSPGMALGIDAASFVVCAAVLARIRVPRRRADGRPGFFGELREGWAEFTSRTWLWASVIIFGLANVFFMFWPVLGPAVANDRLGGAAAWAIILSAGGVGALAGGLLALRYRPSRPLLVSCLAPLPIVLQFATLALHAPVAVIAAASFVAQGGIALHLALWFTVFQREVPEHAQSRVSSYDALGSFVLLPLGAVIAGPVAALIGTDEALWVAAAAIVACNTSIVALPSVRAIRAPLAEPTPVAST
jgi:predicted MFS family arabinose efflux permease